MTLKLDQMDTTNHIRKRHKNQKHTYLYIQGSHKNTKLETIQNMYAEELV